jgi:carboxyl-terminal processing protease
MKPLHAFFIAALLAIGLGWFGLGLVECGAIFLGVVIAVFAAERVHEAGPGHRSSAWWFATFVLGACIAAAGAFDLFDVGRDTGLGDWNMGFVLGLALFGPVALVCAGIGRPMGKAPDGERAGLAALVAGVVLAEITLHFLTDTWSTGGRITDAAIAAAVGFGASVITQIRRGIAPGGPRLLGDLAAAALIATGLVIPTSMILLPIALFGTAWGIAMLGVAGSRRIRVPGAAYREFKQSAAKGTLAAALLCVLGLGALAPRFDMTVSDAVAALEDLLPLPQSVFARLVMSDHYLWAGMSEGTGGSDRDPEAIIEARRHPVDRWSNIHRAAAARAYLRGETSVGIDFLDQDGVTTVGHVHPGSPAAAAGVKRGWRLANVGWRTRESTRLSFTDLEGEPRDVELPGTGSHPPESWWIVAEHAGRRVGYLYLSAFRRHSLELLSSSIASLKREGIEDLVLDLRYNRGGSLRVAHQLASLMAGPALEGGVFQQVIHNRRYRDRDRTLRFEGHAEALGLKRVFVLATGKTCSASEAVIKGLAPHIEVVTIGGTTCGKPVGFSALDYWGVSYWVIDFRLRNAVEQGDYFEGIAPTCPVSEDLRQALGATDESLFAEALQYISTGRCSHAA